MTAAEQLARVASEGLEPSAQAMADKGDGLNDKLVAAAMLGGSRSDAAVQILLRLAEDPEPAVVIMAVRRPGRGRS